MPVSGNVLAAYSDRATDYERRTAPYQEWRELLVDRLPLRRGDVVLDVGCGTGLCFELLQRKIGATGTIIGIDEAPAMLAVAARHVTEHGWRNVELLATPAQDATIAEPADAALFCAVHDVLQSSAALHTVLSALRPGAWVGAAGGNGRPPGLARCPLWSPRCTPRSSGTSPASTALGGTSPSWSMICGSPRSLSVPATWPWAASLINPTAALLR